MSDSYLAFGLAGFAVGSVTLETLAAKGMLSSDEVIDIYDQSLLLLEGHQASAGVEQQHVFEVARQFLDAAIHEVQSSRPPSAT